MNSRRQFIQKTIKFFAIAGKVKTPLKITYSQILGLPAIERRVLLICPGFFSNHGLWMGISILELRIQGFRN